MVIVVVVVITMVMAIVAVVALNVPTGYVPGVRFLSILIGLLTGASVSCDKHGALFCSCHLVNAARATAGNQSVSFVFRSSHWRGYKYASCYLKLRRKKKLSLIEEKREIVGCVLRE